MGYTSKDVPFPGWTLLHAVGEKRPYFGQHDTNLPADATADGPLPELLA